MTKLDKRCGFGFDFSIARAAAIAYSQIILSESKLSDDLALLLEQDDSGLNYVGDSIVVVLYMEGGQIYEVLVRKMMTES